MIILILTKRLEYAAVHKHYPVTQYSAWLIYVSPFAGFLPGFIGFDIVQRYRQCQLPALQVTPGFTNAMLRQGAFAGVLPTVSLCYWLTTVAATTVSTTPSLVKYHECCYSNIKLQRSLNWLCRLTIATTVSFTTWFAGDVGKNSSCWFEYVNSSAPFLWYAFRPGGSRGCSINGFTIKFYYCSSF